MKLNEYICVYEETHRVIANSPCEVQRNKEQEVEKLLGTYLLINNTKMYYRNRTHNITNI